MEFRFGHVGYIPGFDATTPDVSLVDEVIAWLLIVSVFFIIVAFVVNNLGRPAARPTPEAQARADARWRPQPAVAPLAAEDEAALAAAAAQLRARPALLAGEDAASGTCVVCLDDFNAPVELIPCGHVLCAACAAAYVGTRSSVKCPTCRADVILFAPCFTPPAAPAAAGADGDASTRRRKPHRRGSSRPQQARAQRTVGGHTDTANGIVADGNDDAPHHDANSEVAEAGDDDGAMVAAAPPARATAPAARFSSLPQALLNFNRSNMNAGVGVRGAAAGARYVWRNYFNLPWLARAVTLAILAVWTLYVVSPFDILPEATLGLFGLVDDAFAAYVALVFVLRVLQNILT
jgi:hypothetical protein